MQSWIEMARTGGGPRFRAIADAIDQAVRTGALRPGERLPPQRDLARLLGVDLTTVTRAYGLARDAGLIEGAGKLGSFVRNAAPVEPAADREGSGMILPPQPGFALLPEAIRTGLARLLRAGGGSPLLDYQPRGGSPHDRRRAALAMTARGLPTQPEDMLIAAGGQNALHAILGTALKPGDAICAGLSTYPGLLALAARLGLRLLPLPADANGPDPDALERAARDGARALYIVPTNDNPTTATLDLPRRRAVAALARRHGLVIVEDDAYGQLPADPLPPIAALAPELCWHIASVSKILSPALRVAHVRAPSAQAADRLAADIQETAIMAPPLNAALVTAWLADGSFARMVRAVREEGMARQRIAARNLAGTDHAAHPEGYHIWLRLAEGLDPAALAAIVRPLGLSAVPGRAFATDPAAPARALRLSLGGALPHEHLHRALERLSAAMRSS